MAFALPSQRFTGLSILSLRPKLNGNEEAVQQAARANGGAAHRHGSSLNDGKKTMNRWLQSEFKDTFPVASIMKHRLPQFWLRVHSLPESKRYPESEEERNIVVERYTSFGTALLGDQAACYIVRSRMNEKELDPKYRDSFAWISLPRVDESEDDFWSSWYAETVWRPEDFRSLLLDIADERDWGVSFVSKASGSIFAPYDGGSDGFSFDSGLLTRLKHEFQPWLSARYDGL